MPVIGPIKRKDLIKYLKQLGFEGPFSGGKHQFMIREQIRLTIPNPHISDISSSLLIRILRQADVSKDIWLKL